MHEHVSPPAHEDTVLTDADGSEQKSLDSHMLLYCGRPSFQTRFWALVVLESHRWNRKGRRARLQCRLETFLYANTIFCCLPFSTVLHFWLQVLTACTVHFSWQSQVELRRTKSQCLNKLVYIWQGLQVILRVGSPFASRIS